MAINSFSAKVEACQQGGKRALEARMNLFNEQTQIHKSAFTDSPKGPCAAIVQHEASSWYISAVSGLEDWKIQSETVKHLLKASLKNGNFTKYRGFGRCSEARLVPHLTRAHMHVNNEDLRARCSAGCVGREILSAIGIAWPVGKVIG